MENKEISLEQAIVFLEMNAYEGSNGWCTWGIKTYKGINR